MAVVIGTNISNLKLAAHLYKILCENVILKKFGQQKQIQDVNFGR